MASAHLKHIMHNAKLRVLVPVVRWVFMLAVALSAVQTAAQDPGARAGRSGNVVSISDIHFNPFYDPSLMPALHKADYSKWEQIFSHSKIAGYGSHTADTNYNLLRSALDNIQLRAPRADFIIISGDFLAHDFQENYTKLRPGSAPHSVNLFINKTIGFVTWMFRRRFPHTPVYPALGNNDSYCGDYQLEPAGDFLRATARTWKSLLNSETNARSFLQTFPSSGSYTAGQPRAGNHRIVVLNTTFFSKNYQNTCGDPKAEPGTDEMKWLETELTKATAAKQKVWLVYHIPVGVDVYASASKGPAAPPVLLWQANFNQQFIDLLARYASTITAQFAGHIHMDSFQLTQATGPASFVHVTPAISPLFGNNPAFEVLSYVRNSSALKDYSVYYFDLSSPAAQQNAPVRWSKEYSFNQAFGQPGYSTAALQAIYAQIPGDQNGALTKYRTYYNVSNPSSPPFAGDWRPYWCGIGNLTISNYQSCIQQ